MTGPLPDLADLDLLVTVAKTGSIGQAAIASGISQPSVSRKLAAFERRLGVPLLVRTPRGSALTPAGRVVVDWAASLLRAADDFNRSVHALAQETSVAVRAAVSMTIAEHYAPRWLAITRDCTPPVQVSLVVANSADVADMVEVGTADIGFIESPTVRATLRHRRVGVDSVVVVVAPGHPWAGRGDVCAEDLSLMPLLVREAGSGTRGTIELALSREGLRLLTGLQVASNTALKSAAIAGIGPAVVSAATVVEEVARGQLVVVTVQDLPLHRPLSAIWRRDARPSDASRALLDAALSSKPPEDIASV